MASRTKSNYGWPPQAPFSSCQCPTPFAQPHAETCIWIHMLPVLSLSPTVLDVHWTNIFTVPSLLTTDFWQQPHRLVGSGKCVTGFEQWPFALQGIALTTLDLGCAFVECWMLQECLPATSEWVMTNRDISLFPGPAPPCQWWTHCAEAVVSGIPCLSGWKQLGFAKPQIHAVWHSLFIMSRSSIQHILLHTSQATATARTGPEAGPQAPL